MSTRSFVGKINNDGTFKARYVHSDGYPTYLGRALLELALRDGAETVLETVTEEHYGWSNLSADTPDIEGVTPDREADFGSAEFQASLFKGGDHPPIYGDGRFANVPGYGIAYTTKQGQSDPDEWIEGSLDLDAGTGSGDFNWLEWGYLIDTDENSILVLRLDGGFLSVGASAQVAGRIPIHSGEVEELLATVECGDNYEHCSHYAWVHFDVPDESKRLSTSEWLGHEEVSLNNAHKVTVEGVTYRLTGSGVSSEYRHHMSADRATPVIKPGKGWLATARTDTDTEVLVRTRTEGGNPVKGVEYHFPPTAKTAA